MDIAAIPGRRCDGGDVNVHGIWKATIGGGNGQSRLIRSFHKWPLHISKPFTGKNGELMVYLQDASPGLFNGDVQEVACMLERSARLFLTNPAASKLHPSPAAGPSRQEHVFILQEGAVLEYFPEPLVPFAGASYSGQTEVRMERGAQALIAEILTPGRIGRGELFAYQRIRSQFSVYWGGRLAAWDSLVLEPARWETRFGLFDEYTHLATFWVLSERVTSAHLENIHRLLDTFAVTSDGGTGAVHDVYAGVSLLPENGLVVRLLGHSVRAVQARIEAVWRLLRPELLGSEPFRVRK
jgi:urease accessory protein